MAHISRRHPAATPEDFVPGLIHHRPLAIPLSPSQLPLLPHTATILPDVLTPSGMVRPYPIGPSERSKRLVARGCFSGRRPRKEHFEDRRGAAAAIAAVIENSRRLAEKLDEQGESLGQPAAQSATGDEMEVPMTAWTTRTDVTLVDVLRSAATAREDARYEMEAEVKQEDDDCVSPESKPTVGDSRLKVGSMSLTNEVRGDLVLGSGKSERSSECEGDPTVREAEEGVKRSERLRRRRLQTCLAVQGSVKKESSRANS